MAITAEQIAKRVGLSNATVSRVLNNSQPVSLEAREAVLAVVRESGHMPRLLGPRNSRIAPKATPTQTGFVQVLQVARFPIVPISAIEGAPYAMASESIPQSRFFAEEARLTTSYARHIINGILNEVGNFGMRAVVQVVENLDSRQLLNEVNSKENKGVFLLGIYDEDVPEFLDKCHCPVVTFTTWDHKGWPDYVGIDNYKGIRIGFDHLKNLGHKRIGFIAGELRYSAVFQERLAAYKACVADAGWQYRPDWIVEGSCNLDLIEADVERVLKSPDRPTAILCCFDGAAIAIKRAADRLGLQIPTDLSVVGFDDEDIAQLFTPPLTTLHVPTVQMGQSAVHLLMMRQQRPIRPGEGCSLRVTPTLNERQSTAPPPAE